ncbi:hypothetical protein EDC96DRAFT_86612 [Choanephora cucurbitarum]|nr:hypothetical protein EDC96DRAFT_86612 [Choanephora cucurbitarum]
MINCFWVGLLLAFSIFYLRIQSKTFSGTDSDNSVIRARENEIFKLLRIWIKACIFVNISFFFGYILASFQLFLQAW